MAIDLGGLLHAIDGHSAVVVGDTMLDVYLRGATHGLCREAPAPAVTVQTVERVPGGAANSAA
ncbi:MAG: D-glycero-beta-D-manno-heptose 1-phosphate adenylyltransferase, partial [Gammaproteobacteria bacterium]